MAGRRKSYNYEVVVRMDKARETGFYSFGLPVLNRCEPTLITLQHFYPLFQLVDRFKGVGEAEPSEQNERHQHDEWFIAWVPEGRVNDKSKNQC